MFTIAKVTSKGQTTIPQRVRAALHVEPGDLIAWEVGPDGSATVRRVEPMDLEYLRAVEATLGEWAGAADEDVLVPPWLVNGLLRRVSQFDLALARRVRVPVGSSLLAIARRPVAVRVAGSGAARPRAKRAVRGRAAPDPATRTGIGRSEGQ